MRFCDEIVSRAQDEACKASVKDVRVVQPDSRWDGPLLRYLESRAHFLFSFPLPCCRKSASCILQGEREGRSLFGQGYRRLTEKFVQYEDGEDTAEVLQQPAPPPPANNASTFPALGNTGGIPASEPIKGPSHSVAKVPSQSAPQQLQPKDPAVLQMGPTAAPHNNPAGAVSSAL